MPGMFSHAHSQPAVLLADSEHLCSPLRLHHLLLHAGTMAQLDESVWRPYQDYASLGASYHAQALCHRRVCGGLPTTCSHEYLRTCPTKRNTDVALSLSRPRWVPCPCVCAWCLSGTGCGVMCWLMLMVGNDRQNMVGLTNAYGMCVGHFLPFMVHRKVICKDH